MIVAAHRQISQRTGATDANGLCRNRARPRGAEAARARRVRVWAHTLWPVLKSDYEELLAKAPTRWQEQLDEKAQAKDEKEPKAESGSEVQHVISLRRHYPEQVLVGSTAPPSMATVAALSARHQARAPRLVVVLETTGQPVRRGRPERYKSSP